MAEIGHQNIAPIIQLWVAVAHLVQVGEAETSTVLGGDIDSITFFADCYYSNCRIEGSAIARFSPIAIALFFPKRYRPLSSHPNPTLNFS